MRNSNVARNVKAVLNGMRGVHLVAAELARWGFAPVVTMRNTAFADILAQPLSFDGVPLSISVKYNAGGAGTFFLLGKKPLPKAEKYFLVLVLEAKGKPTRMWVVPSRTLAESPATKVKRGTRRLDKVPKGYLGLHEGVWGNEVYFQHLKEDRGPLECLKDFAPLGAMMPTTTQAVIATSAPGYARRKARSLIGWLSEGEGLLWITGREMTQEPDPAHIARCREARAAVARRPEGHIQSKMFAPLPA